MRKGKIINNKKGFSIIPAILILAGILVVAGGVTYFMKKGKNESIQPKVQTAQEQHIDETKDWKTYNSSKYGFEFKYPQSYVLESDSDTIILKPQNINAIFRIDVLPGSKQDFSKFEVFGKTIDGLNIYLGESMPPSYTYLVIKNNMWFSFGFDNIDQKELSNILNTLKFIK